MAISIKDTLVSNIGAVSSTGDTTVTGNLIADNKTIDAIEISRLDGLTDAIQPQLDLKAPLASPTFTGTVSGISKAMVGLGNVDNTSDANKPVSTATQTALDLKANQSTTYTKTETDTRIQAVVGAAPAALDTLVEIAT